ncbi:hypothetical protein LEMLEM_LOCUS166 [Lemmus lemmus]
MKATVPSPNLHETKVVVHICNPSTREVEAGGSEVPGHPATVSSRPP